MKNSFTNFLLKFKIVYWAIIIVAIFGIYAASNVEAQPFPKTVKFGCVLPLTGPMAVNGAGAKAAYETVVEYINEKGGIKGFGGAKFEVVFADNQVKPAVAATEAERLIQQEKVVALVGWAPSAVTMAASAVAERYKIPYLDPISFADQLCQRGYEYFFEVQPTAYHMAETQMAFLNYFNNTYKMGIKRVGLIHEDTNYGKSLSKAQRELLPKNGFDVVADVEHNAKAPDLTSPVLKLKAAKPQFIIESTYFADALQIAKAAQRQGLNVPFIDAETRSEFAWIKAAGPAGELSFCLIEWDRSYPHPTSRLLTERFEKRFKDKASHYVGGCMQIAFILKKAIEKAGSADPTLIKDALHEIEILPGPELIMPYERIKFDKTGMNRFGRPFVAQIQDGELLTVS